VWTYLADMPICMYVYVYSYEYNMHMHMDVFAQMYVAV